MLKQFLVATAGAIAASLSPVAVVAAQSPPTIQLSGTEYVIDFKLGVFGDNIVELEAQPWYAVNDFTLAASAAGRFTTVRRAARLPNRPARLLSMPLAMSAVALGDCHPGLCMT